jgi:hypothetical protein
MPTSDPAFVDFLITAKTCTYAASNRPDFAGAVTPSRPGSRDLAYQAGPYTYRDSYFGGQAFIGDEVVWLNAAPIWGMSYYGSMEPTAASSPAAGILPPGFSDFLKLALGSPPRNAPFRGPAIFERRPFAYTCSWQGSLSRFHGSETIRLDGEVIYTLSFFGGEIR